MHLFLICILIALGTVHSASVDGAAGEGYKSYKDYKVFSVSGDRLALVNLSNFLTEYENSLRSDARGSIFIQSNDNSIEVMVSPTALDIYQEAISSWNLNSTLTIEDFSEIINKENRADKSRGFNWSDYHEIDVIYEWLTNMSKSFPDAAKLVVGGKTYEGRQILGMRILTPDPNGNKKPIVFIESGIHAREWIAPATTTYFINELLTSKDSKIQALRDAFEWHIFPSTNPDGYQYSHTNDRMWRKTRSKSPNGCYGADPNRNWDYNWGVHGVSRDPCNKEIYAGSKQFSEVETRTLSEYLTSLGKILAYLDFHSYGPCILIPFSDTTSPVHNQKDLVAIGKMSLKHGQTASGLRPPYKGPAPAPNILSKVSGSSMDWAVTKLKIPLAFVYELRGHGFHWPKERIPEQGVEVTQMIVGLFVKAKEMGYY